MSIFGSSYSAVYDSLYEAKDYGRESDLIEEAFARFAVSPRHALLDVGCGTGKHAIELARRGHAVTGIDLSPAMIERACQAAGRLPDAERPAFTVGDARTFEVDTKFDAAVMMFAVIGYLTSNNDVLGAFRNIRRHLKKDGLFVFDFWYGPAVLSDPPGDRVRVIEDQDRTVIRTTKTTLDTQTHCADVQFNLWMVDGERLLSSVAETHKVRYFFAQELALMLAGAEFDLVHMSEFPTLDRPPNRQSWNAIAVARAV